MQQRKSDSCVWKGLLWTRDVFEKGCCWKVGDGSNINLCTDPWIPELPNQTIPAQILNNQAPNDRYKEYYH